MDRRYPERLAGSFLASLVIHALLALLLFSVLVSSSEQGATENVQGGEVVTLERRSPIEVAQRPANVQVAVPVPHVPRIAPVQHAALVQTQTQRLPANRHELAVQAPTAPPNPRPIPQQSPQPNPQPTTNIYEAQPRNELPAAPISVSTVAPVAVSLKPPPTIAPSPAPSSAAARTPNKSTAAQPKPSAKPTPAQAVPKPLPSAPAVSTATAAPKASPAPAAHASAAPTQRPGVPSPSPTSTTAVAKTAGTAPVPGPKGAASPGPREGSGPQNKSAAERPIEVRPTPAAGSVTPRPSSTGGINLNAKLRALLPNNPVHPTSKQYTPTYSLRGRLEPTPPPDVLAKTKYLYQSRGTGGDALVKMWVTAARKAGPTTICTGWLVRYPQPERGGYAPLPSNGNANVPTANGTQISIGGGGGAEAHAPLSPFDAGIAPVVEGIISEACDGRLLVPYSGPAAASP